ncbi:MAG: glycerophosphodiester phosphodiesterase [Holosporales bacterium]
MVALIAHRGWPAQYDENTIEGFVAASLLSPDFIECDLQLTRDGQLVVHHDFVLKQGTPTTDPTVPERSWLIRDLVAHETVPSNGYNKGDGPHLPTLDTLLSHPQLRHCQWALEVKSGATSAFEGMANLILTCLQAHQAVSRVKIISFDWSLLATIRSLNAEVRLGFLTDWGYGFNLAACIRRIQELQGTWWGLHHSWASPHLIEAAKTAGIKTNFWTVNDLDRARELMAMGADGLTTDHIDRFVVLKSHGPVVTPA